jgi:uncharacterized membrane protein YeiH
MRKASSFFIIDAYAGECMSQYIMILEMVGTVAFAISGALVAINANLDLLGIVVLGVITATGGGILRDILLGQLPPLAFRDPLYVAVGAVTAVIVFLIVYFGVHTKSEKDSQNFRSLLLILDSIGLAIFTVMGVNAAWELFAEKNHFLCVFSGVVTGVGGGLLRDMTVNELPYIFSKHIYAIASIVGGEVCVLLLQAGNTSAAIWSGTAVILLIRLLAAHYRWSLPKAQRNKDTGHRA